MDFIVIPMLAWLAVDVLFLISALVFARRRERRFRRTVATMVETAERYGNLAPSPSERRPGSGALEGAALVRPHRRPVAWVLEPASPASELLERKEGPYPKTEASSTYGIKVQGIDDVMLRLAKCCRPVPGDPIVGYISLGKGITIHHDDCPDAKALKKNPERFTPVAWEGDSGRLVPRRAPDRRLGPHPAARGPVANLRRDRHQHSRGPLHRGAPDGQEPLRRRGGGHAALKAYVQRLRNIESVFDAYRVTPTG
jgi:hypothetical protein